ncbi:6156_t:CDS:2, partial [Funneliformis caledonium]
WQTSVKDAIPTIKKEMATRYKQDSDIKLYVKNPKGLAKALKEVLAEYGIDSNDTDTIPIFLLQTHEIQDSNEHFEHCMAEILVRLKNYGSLVVDILEVMRNEYIVAILHTVINITRDATGKEFKSSGRVDFTIKEAEDLICVAEDKPQRNIVEGYAQNIKQLKSSFQTNKRKRKWDDDDFDYLYSIVTTARDWHFLLYTPRVISQCSKLPLSIEFSEDALKKDSVEYQTLHNGVKKVLSVVVGLLKDRACAEDDSSSKKKARIEEYRSKK